MVTLTVAGALLVGPVEGGVGERVGAGLAAVRGVVQLPCARSAGHGGHPLRALGADRVGQGARAAVGIGAARRHVAAAAVLGDPSGSGCCRPASHCRRSA